MSICTKRLLKTYDIVITFMLAQNDPNKEADTTIWGPYLHILFL